MELTERDGGSFWMDSEEKGQKDKREVYFQVKTQRNAQKKRKAAQYQFKQFKNAAKREMLENEDEPM